MSQGNGVNITLNSLAEPNSTKGGLQPAMCLSSTNNSSAIIQVGNMSASCSIAAALSGTRADVASQDYIKEYL